MDTEKRYLITKDGGKMLIVGETGRYYIGRDRQIRKSNPMIDRIEVKKAKKAKKEAPEHQGERGEDHADC